MKKTIMNIILMAAVFLLGSTQVNALISLEPKGISNLCVKKDETSITIRFDINQDVDFSTFGMLNVHGEDPKYNDFNREGEKEFKIVDNSTTCESTNVSGTEITESAKITTGSTLYLHKELESSDFNKLIIVMEYVNDDNDKFGEAINYNINEASIESVESYNMSYCDRMIDAISQKYNNYIIPLSGDEYGAGFYFDVDKGQNEEYSHAVELGWIDFSDYTKSEADILKEIADLLIKANIAIPIAEETNKMTNSYLEGIKAIETIVTYEQKENDKVVASWVFDGSKMTSTDYDIDLTIKVGDNAQNKDTIITLFENKENVVPIEFNYHGELPKGTKVRINVANRYANGEKLHLYYYNDNKQLELIQSNLEVKDGFVEFDLEHCSLYALTNYVSSNAVNKTNNAQTGTLNVFLYIGLAAASISGIALTLRKKETE